MSRVFRVVKRHMMSSRAHYESQSEVGVEGGSGKRFCGADAVIGGLKTTSEQTSQRILMEPSS